MEVGSKGDGGILKKCLYKWVPASSSSQGKLKSEECPLTYRLLSIWKDIQSWWGYIKNKIDIVWS